MGKQINRRPDVVSRIEGDETLVLDTVSNTAHCLSGAVAVVWNAHEYDASPLAARTGLTIDAVEHAVASLAELGLVTAPAGLSRRTLVTRGAVVGGALVAAGAVSIPLPASATTVSGGTFQLNSGCDADHHGIFDFEEGGGVLAGPQLNYHVLVAYTSYDIDPSTHALTEVIRTIDFDIITQGEGKPLQGPFRLNATPTTVTSTSPAGDVTSVVDNQVDPLSITVGTAGGKDGFLKMTTGGLFAGWAVPPAGPGPQDALTGLEDTALLGNQTTNGTTSGNVYLQVTPIDDQTLPHWNGYFNKPPCYTIAST